MVFTKLLTLTVPTKIEVPEEYVRYGWAYGGRLSGRTTRVGPNSEHAYRYMAQRFNRFQTSARRRWTYSYFRVVEEGTRKPYVDSKGRPRLSKPRVHYHLLVMCREYMPQPVLVSLAERAGLGRVVHITAALSDDDVSRYLAKYATKQSGSRVPRGLRFYVMSQDWAARARAARALRLQMEKEARRAAGWRAEYVNDAEAALIAEELASGGPEAGARGFERPEMPVLPTVTVDWEQLDLEAAA